jgi:hypothetical protein
MTTRVNKASYLQVGSSGSSFNEVGNQNNEEERGELHDGIQELDWLLPDTYTQQAISASAPMQFHPVEARSSALVIRSS